MAMTTEDLRLIRAIVREEVQEAVSGHLAALTAGVLGPISMQLVEILASQKLVSDGQLLVERSLADRTPDDDEPWRQSLAPDDN